MESRRGALRRLDSLPARSAGMVENCLAAGARRAMRRRADMFIDLRTED